jgi:hypothetical protein
MLVLVGDLNPHQKHEHQRASKDASRPLNIPSRIKATRQSIAAHSANSAHAAIAAVIQGEPAKERVVLKPFP